MKINSGFTLTAMALTSLLLVACSDSDSDGVNNPIDNTPTDPTTDPVVDQNAVFEVQVTNLTHAQPLSPVAIMFHSNGFNSFIDGEPSSLALELLAEGGNNADILSEAQAAVQHVASASTDGAVPPQAISPVVSLTFPVESIDDLRLSVISMLVRTNDAFTGTNAANISGMDIGDTRTLTGPTWDSGTEANSESSATIPGPGFGGEGFNSARDDRLNVVRFHAGVVTSASAESGLASSALGEEHRFLNPSSRIQITRVQ